ncbi:MAG: dihydrofolate reductase [Alphaproteobacteria bacterium]|nr:dihydrofolate reductase [Alphaproteobacteria bacterium]
MLNICFVVAASLNNVIGKNNQLIWKIPIDLKYFKNRTYGLPIVMGRKTFDSINQKPLPGRLNIVLSKQKFHSQEYQNLYFLNHVDEVFKLCNSFDYKTLHVVGGSQIYNAFLPCCNTIFLTKVLENFEGDTFFKVPDNFSLKKMSFYPVQKGSPFPIEFQIWQKNQ